ncbi:MAG: LacI family DNA-binding transcriptional regulator [bacterium]
MALQKQCISDIEINQVTQADIARACGMRQATVSRALNGSSLVNEETRVRIAEIAMEMGYDLNQHDAARRMIMRRRGKQYINKVIALLYPRENLSGDGFFGRLFRGISTVVTAEEFGLLVQTMPNSLTDDHAPIPLQHMFSGGNIDGIIHFPMYSTRDIIPRLRTMHGFGNRPVVSLMAPMAGTTLIDTDQRQAGYIAGQHLLELGHKHILHFIFPTENTAQELRLAGLRDAYAHAGLNAADYLKTMEIVLFNSWMNPGNLPGQRMNVPDAEIKPDPYREQFLAFMHTHPEITAIIGLNDANALQTWYALSGIGWRIPDDISIIGFDDTDGIFDSEGRNLLTSLHVPLEEIGEIAARQIISQITETDSAEDEIILPIELMVRSSTAPRKA